MYENQFDHTIEAGCPWYSQQQFFGPPNIKWCEPTICAWINEPFNAWSNLFYFVVGLVVLFKYTTPWQRNFGYIVLFTGVASFIYHSTNNFLTQYFDYLGMLLLVSFVLSFNQARSQEDRKLFSIYFGWIFAALLILFQVLVISKIPIQLLVGAGCILIVFQELFLLSKKGLNHSFKYFTFSVLLLGLGQLFALLDHKRLFCPSDQLWVSGHVLWHVFGSLALGAYALHIGLVDKELSRQGHR